MNMNRLTPPPDCDDLGAREADQLGALLFDDAKDMRYSPTIEVDRQSVRKLVEDYREARGDADFWQAEHAKLQSRLAADADWRTRSDDEPARSMVAVLLGAVERQELLPTETPYELAESVARRCTDLAYDLQRERSRQFRVVTTGGFPGVAIVDVRELATERLIHERGEQVDCAGWPRWAQLSHWYESGGVAYFTDEDDETIRELLSQWALSPDDTEDDELSAPTWVMFPDRFIDPNTLCTAEPT